MTNRARFAIAVCTLIYGGYGSPAAYANPIPTQQDPATVVELVRDAVANEVAASQDSKKHMFRERKQTPQGSQTRLYVETVDAMAGMTIAYNDQPLASEQVRGEEDRLAALEGNADQLSRKRSHEKETADRTLLIIKALPEAFSYRYDGEETGTSPTGRTIPFVRLKFEPNPNYQPPSHVEQVLLGMHGVLVIDPAARRIAKIDGRLFKEVSFGWGILGHLDKGGHFLVEQRDVGNGCWDVSHMSLEFTGKILLFKSLAIKSDQQFSDFRLVPSDTTFSQGVELLKAEEVKLAENQRSGASKAEITKSESR